MSVVARALWDENADLAQAAVEHSFVRGIATGSLPRACFADYVAQDAYFLDAFARTYALALAHVGDQEGVASFARLIAGAVDELRLHRTYAARWGIALDAVRPLPATLAYTDFLLATASLQGTGATCAAMTPCMRLYAYLGTELARRPEVDGNPYAEWIATYASGEFASLTAELEALLDRYATLETARAPYRRALELEVGLFDAHAEGLR